ncbi:MAG: DNA primase [Magnetococcales bacterium]|nr:DNA primase [Magnetococcales bacterium]
MPRYPDSFIEEVRERIDFLGLVGRHVQLKKSGSSWLGLCPFHHEKTPSFTIRPDKGFFKCFGCGQGGDAFEFLMKIRGLTFNETVEELALGVGLALPVTSREYPHSQIESDKKTRLLKILTESRDYFHRLLMQKEGQTALNYLQNRGLTEHIIQQFHLGYAPGGWHALAEHFSGFPDAPALLEEVGLRINKGDGSPPYDRFRDRVIFPIHDTNGRCVGFGGRTMDPQGKPKYINSPETPLYQKGHLLYGLNQSREAIQKQGEIILVEGYMDLISLVSHGVNNCVATLGTALTDEQVQLLWKRSRRIVFCFDGDRAGRQAAWRALEKMIDGLEADHHVRFLFLPQGDDPDQFVRQHGREKFLHLVEKAVGLFEFLTEKLGMDLGLATPEGKAALIHRLRPYLKRIPDPVLLQLLTQSLAQKIQVPEWAILRDGRPRPLFGTRAAQKSDRNAEKTSPELVGRDWERTLLALLLRFPRLIAQYEEDLVAVELYDASYSELLSTLVAMSPQLLSAGDVLDTTNLTVAAMRSLADAILANEEVQHEHPDKELEHYLGKLADRNLESLQKQTRNQDISNDDAFNERFRVTALLQQERHRVSTNQGSSGYQA